MKKQKKTWQDDGRVIANMNVEGMANAFYKPRSRRRFDEFGQTSNKPEPILLTRGEHRSISHGVCLAYLAAIGLLMVLLSAFMLFVSFVWFRS
jgi:hypothetical protein